MNKTIYSVLSIEVIEVSVEAGIAQTTGGGGEGGIWQD